MKRTIHIGSETKTEKQWLKEGRLIKADARGERLWTNGYCQILAVYYKIEETYQATKDEIRKIREPQLKKKREYARKKREYERAVKFREVEIKKAKELPSVLCKNPSKIVVFDVETTGMHLFEDEILQFSACDGDGNTLMNTYIRPYLKKTWEEAEHIHGISSDMVADAPYIHEILPIIKGIFEGAEVFVAYNGGFDIRFLEEGGIDIDFANKEYHDVMLMFAPIFGEWNEYYGNYTWQKLSTCASYFGYEFKAHDSMEDVRATLHCWKLMKDYE